MRQTETNNHPASTRRTQTERHQEAEHKLLDAALQLVAKKGLSRITLSDIGDLSGYSRTLPAYHFGSLGGLVLALIEHIRQIFAQSVNVQSPPVEGLDMILGLAETSLTPSPELHLAQRAIYILRGEAIIDESDIYEPIKHFYREWERFVEDQLRIGIERGEIRSDIRPASPISADHRRVARCNQSDIG